MIVPDAHICEEMLSVDLAIDTVLYNTGCDEYGPYLEPSIYMTNLGTDDITELCIKFQVLGQTNDTVCFTGQSYLPLESGDSAVQEWPKLYVDGVLSLHLTGCKRTITFLLAGLRYRRVDLQQHVCGGLAYPF